MSEKPEPSASRAGARDVDGVYQSRPDRLAAFHTGPLTLRALPRWLMPSEGSNGALLPVLVSLVIIAAFFQIESRYYLSPGNLSNLAIQITILGPVALGEVLVLLLGEIDLSLGSISGATAAILGVLLGMKGLPWWAAVVMMLLAGAGMGLIQGVWVSWFRVPSFVVTLAGLLAWLGVQLDVLGASGTLNVFQPDITALTSTSIPPPVGWGVGLAVLFLYAGSQLRRARERKLSSLGAVSLSLILGRILGVAIIIGLGVGVLNASGGAPTGFVVFLGIVAVVWWVTQRTVAGRHLFAVGGNTEAARRAGIRVRTIRTMTFMAAGTLGAVGGLFSASYNQSAGTLTGGGTLLLEAIGAAVIGGTSLFGGRGTAWAALFGSLILGGVDNGLDLTNHSAPVRYMVEGAIVLIAVSFDTLIRRSRAGGAEDRG